MDSKNTKISYNALFEIYKHSNYFAIPKQLFFSKSFNKNWMRNNYLWTSDVNFLKEVNYYCIGLDEIIRKLSKFQCSIIYYNYLNISPLQKKFESRDEINNNVKIKAVEIYVNGKIHYSVDDDNDDNELTQVLYDEYGNIKMKFSIPYTKREEEYTKITFTYSDTCKDNKYFITSYSGDQKINIPEPLVKEIILFKDLSSDGITEFPVPDCDIPYLNLATQYYYLKKNNNKNIKLEWIKKYISDMEKDKLFKLLNLMTNFYIYDDFAKALHIYMAKNVLNKLKFQDNSKHLEYWNLPDNFSWLTVTAI